MQKELKDSLLWSWYLKNLNNAVNLLFCKEYLSQHRCDLFSNALTYTYLIRDEADLLKDLFCFLNIKTSYLSLQEITSVSQVLFKWKHESLIKYY